MIEIFNERFFVPFKLNAPNRVSVILGSEPVLRLGFTFDDGADKIAIEKDALMLSLSTGEKKALYILNLLFEIEVRIKAGIETLLIVDDIADSFDYKNKYAIIQYLKDLSEDQKFKQVILTHNFDFFRTINSRFVRSDHCLMATKNSSGVALEVALGVKNVFIKDWKPNFFTDSRKQVASIPFIRNLIEYTKGHNDPDYSKLTSLLHWKADSLNISVGDLDGIYQRTFGGTGTSVDPAAKVITVIHHEAGLCLTAATGINFENKIVLAIAIRLKAEEFMVSKIADPAWVAAITRNQTPKLLARYKMQFSGGTASIATIQRVVLMTPENIHLNSFMYEPILDMSDEHLRKLYAEVVALK
ncbi:MAG: AAA family ATPase [Opitutae bacterium]|nr:AAA family ATPase [Opitutae bacterium]